MVNPSFNLWKSSNCFYWLVEEVCWLHHLKWTYIVPLLHIVASIDETETSSLARFSSSPSHGNIFWLVFDLSHVKKLFNINMSPFLDLKFWMEKTIESFKILLKPFVVRSEKIPAACSICHGGIDQPKAVPMSCLAIRLQLELWQAVLKAKRNETKHGTVWGGCNQKWSSLTSQLIPVSSNVCKIIALSEIIDNFSHRR